MTIKTLHSIFLECNSISTDTRKVSKNDMFFALKGDNFNGNKFAEDALKKGAKYVIVDEQEYVINEQTLYVENSLEALQSLASFHRNYLNIPIIALTGSNGKTTTKELIHAVLSEKYNTTATKGNLNNHIGVPLTLLSMNKQTEIGIVEMGANHLKEINFLCNIAKPDYGYITNFGKAHLEGFGSLKGVIQGKTELYRHIKTANKTLFINSNDEQQKEQSKDCNIFTFGNSKTKSEVIIDLKEAQPYVKVLYDNLEICSQLIGDYNFNNISAAICIGNYFKVNDNAIKQAIESYTPNNNRSQIINKNTTKIILDAYNANPTSMRAAINNFSKLKEKNKILILGDMFELGSESEKEHQELVNDITALNFSKVILVGQHFFNTKSDASNFTHYNSFDDLQQNLKTINFNEASLLIKGSRGMALERLVDLI